MTLCTNLPQLDNYFTPYGVGELTYVATGFEEGPYKWKPRCAPC